MAISDHQTHLEFLRYLFESPMDKIGLFAGASAVALPYWWPTVNNISTDLAPFVPILGVIWLSLQIGLKLWDRIRGRRGDALED